MSKIRVIIIISVLPASQSWYESHITTLKAVKWHKNVRGYCYFCCLARDLIVCLSIAQENWRYIIFAIYEKEKKAMSWYNFCVETDDVTKMYNTIAMDTPPCSFKSSSLSLPSSASSFCFIHLINRYFLSTCQVSGPVGNRNKTRKKTNESLPWRSWRFGGRVGGGEADCGAFW